MLTYFSQFFGDIVMNSEGDITYEVAALQAKVDEIKESYNKKIEELK